MIEWFQTKTITTKITKHCAVVQYLVSIHPFWFCLVLGVYDKTNIACQFLFNTEIIHTLAKIIRKCSMPFCLKSKIIHPKQLIFSDSKRSWRLYYRGWIISILIKKGVFVLLYVTNTIQHLGGKGLQNIANFGKFFFVKTEIKNI